jgi:hypothetical protein
MTATATHPTATGRAYGPAIALLRLGRLHATSRRIPMAVGLHGAFGALFAIGLHFHWTVAGGPAAQLLLQLTVVSGVGSVTAVCTYGPFGEAERATGRWLPWLRLAAATALTATAFGALAAGAGAGAVPSGNLGLLRDVAGTTGLGLLTSAILGGAFGWTGPMAYYLITEVALTGHPTTPWIWAARPAHDVGAGLCASLVLVAGLLAVTLSHGRDRAIVGGT